jgi:enoyl-CoA hydratase/carnithine racemase
MPKLLIDRQAEVTVLTLNRPEVHNNVDRELAVALAEAIVAFGANAGQKVLVVTGRARRRFVRGRI